MQRWSDQGMSETYYVITATFAHELRWAGISYGLTSSPMTFSIIHNAKRDRLKEWKEKWTTITRLYLLRVITWLDHTLHLFASLLMIYHSFAHIYSFIRFFFMAQKRHIQHYIISFSYFIRFDSLEIQITRYCLPLSICIQMSIAHTRFQFSK